MPFSDHRVHETLHADARAPLRPPAEGWPFGAPSREYTRTPAAARVGRLAARDGLFLFHFERRAHLPLPEAWVPEDRPDLALPPTWEDGVLPESKYQSFRHDLALGSFHPMHRAKWTVHELCHGLVGFGWRPGGSRFFHATAGRLAELLPVALWYFFDEAFLRRCPVHEGAGALFQDLCPDCEAVATTWADDPEARRLLVEGRRFLDGELAAIARSRRLGRPIPHRYATIDLCSDGVAYADAHAARLDSEAFLTFAARFLVEGGGWSPSLDDLEGRVIEVARALAGEVEPRPFAPTATHGRWRWILQDVAWRLLTVWEESERDVADALERAIGLLAAANDVTRHAEVTPEAVEGAAATALRQAVDLYRSLHDEYVLPAPDEVFGVGYDLVDGLGTAAAQVLEGVRSATPLAARALGAALDPLFERFLDDDGPAREPLAVRWSAFLAAHAPGPIADLARYEAALRVLPPGDKGAARALGWQGASAEVRLAPGVALHRFDTDVVGLAEALDAEDADTAGIVESDWTDPLVIAVSREADGEIGVTALDAAAAEALAALGDGGLLDLPVEDVESLEAHGLLAPARWSEQA